MMCYGVLLTYSLRTEHNIWLSDIKFAILSLKLHLQSPFPQDQGHGSETEKQSICAQQHSGICITAWCIARQRAFMKHNAAIWSSYISDSGTISEAVVYPAHYETYSGVSWEQGRHYLTVRVIISWNRPALTRQGQNSPCVWSFIGDFISKKIVKFLCPCDPTNDPGSAVSALTSAD